MEHSIDREKVIKGLMVCVDRIPGKYSCNECPYEIDGNDCEINMTKDALALLKEQGAQKFFVDESGKITPLPVVVRCKDCKHKEESVSPSWEAWCNRLHCGCDFDWFCADGERK